MHLKYLLLVVLMVNIFAVPSTYAQIKVTNEDGDKIILMPDGTWRYADDKKQASASQDVKAKQKSGKAKIDEKKLSKDEKKKLKKIAQDKKRSERIRKKLAKQEAEKAKKEKKILEKEAKKQVELARKEEKKQKNTKKDKSDNNKNTKVAKGARKEKKTKSDNASKQRKTNKKSSNKNSSENLADKGGKTSKKSRDKPTKKMQAKLVKQQFKPFKTLNIVEYKPECEYSMNEVDVFTKQKKIAIEPTFFFGYTHPKLETYLRGEYYLTCEGYMSEVGSLKALNLKFIIDSPNAQEDYGVILEGSRMLVNLLDGTTVTLVSAEEDGGRVDRGKKQTIYKTYFIIDGRNEKKLKKSEISQVRMVWSRGFEDYEVFEVDFLINQLECLENADK